MSSPFRKNFLLTLAACPLTLAFLSLPGAQGRAQNPPPAPATAAPPQAESSPSKSSVSSSTPVPIQVKPAPAKAVPAQPHSSAPKTPAQPQAATQASASASAQGTGFLTQKVNLSDTHHVWHPSRKQLGLVKSGGTYSVDTAKLTSYLKSIAPYIQHAPKPARITITGSQASNPLSSTSSSVPVAAKVLPASPGIKLNLAGSVWKVKSALASNPKATHLLLSVASTPAADATDKFAGINARIAHFVTRFNPGEQGRTQTVRLAIKMINGHVVPPGGVFSVNQTVGERTAARGFGKGIVFVAGKQESQLGGGMCQVSTTLFNAALLGNLKIVQRYQHVRTVPYVKPGQDATVYWGQKDFKFENDTKTPIYISYRTTATHAICDLYGKADPSVKVAIHDSYEHVGPRHYTATLRRYVTKGGVKSNDYTVKSNYKWTPSLDYNI